jgi:hypothetical protein
LTQVIGRQGKGERFFLLYFCLTQHRAIWGWLGFAEIVLRYPQSPDILGAGAGGGRFSVAPSLGD